MQLLVQDLDLTNVSHFLGWLNKIVRLTFQHRI